MMDCSIAENQRLCAGLYRLVPCCELDRERKGPDPDRSPRGWKDLGLAAQIFEMAVPLIQKDVIQLQAAGTCMFPAVRPGTVLTVQPKKAEQIQVGEIAVFRRQDTLFAHRVIFRGQRGGDFFIQTRPDAETNSLEGPFFDSDILGVLPPENGWDLNPSECSPLLRRVLDRFWFNLYRLRESAFDRGKHLLTSLQQKVLYEKVAGKIFSWRGKKVEWAFLVPLRSSESNRFWQILSDPQEIPLHMPDPNCSIAMLKMILKINSQPGASLLLVHKPETCSFSGWWIAQLSIRLRYQGTDLAERILEKGAEAVHALGGRRFLAGFGPEGPAMKPLLRRAGFRDFLTLSAFAHCGEREGSWEEGNILAKEIRGS